MRISIIIAAAIAMLALAPTAMAHNLSSGTAKCDANGITADINFVSFNDSNKPVHWKGYVDDAPTLSGTFTFPGSNGTLHITAPGVPGTHTLKFVATWPGQGDMNGTVTTTVTCPTLPVVPPVTPPVVVTPPADVPPVVAPPAVTPPAVTPAVVPTRGVSPARASHHRKSRPHRCDRRYSPRKHKMVFVCPRKTYVITPKFTG